MTEPLTVHSGDFDTISAGLYPANLVNSSDGTGTVTGVVWLDGSGNNVLDAGETGVAGATVMLVDSSNGTTLGPVTTNADGSYLITEVPQGTYTAVVTAPTGYTVEIPDTAEQVTVSPFGATAANIGVYQPSSISGTVTDDVSGNGIGGVQVTLLNQTGTPVSYMTTAPDGSYSFSNLIQGSYSVRFVTVGGTTLELGDCRVGPPQ